MTEAYRPYNGSTAARVIEFFQHNPDEELTRSDVAVKFDLRQTSVAGTLAGAVQAGLLAWERNDANRWVYRAGKASEESSRG